MHFICMYACCMYASTYVRMRAFVVSRVMKKICKVSYVACAVNKKRKEKKSKKKEYDLFELEGNNRI